jgi:hypothetical protein
VITGLARRSGRPLVMVAPYAALNLTSASDWGARLAARVVVGGLVADAVGAGALALGSLRSRTLLI